MELGKTTLLRMIAGILEPTEGEISFDGLTYKKNEIEIKKQIAYLSGNTKLYDTLSCYELLKMCADIYGVEEKKAEESIVNIARCLVHNPKYYILDEATTGLDIISSQIILDFMKEEKKKNKIILYSTHYMEEAENICDRVIMINKGLVINEGTPEEIKSKTNTSNLRDAFFTMIGGVLDEE